MMFLPPELVPPGYDAGDSLGSGPWSRYARARRIADGTAVTLGVLDAGLAPVDAIAAALRAIPGTEAFPAPADVGVVPGTSVVWYAYDGAVDTPVIARLANGPLAADDAAALGIEAITLLLKRFSTDGGHGAISPAVLVWDGRRAQILDAGFAAVALEARLAPLGGGGPYLAPEIAAGGSPSEHGDMYALGASLYELVTGRPPFGGRTTSTVMATVLAESEARSETERSANYIVDAILRAIEKDPADRWPTLDTFAAALAGERPTTPPKAGTAVQARRWGCLPALLAMLAGSCLAG